MFRKMLTVMAICVIASLTGAFATAQTYAEVDARGIPTIAPLLEDVTQSVVNIAVVSEQPVELNPLFNDPFFDGSSTCQKPRRISRSRHHRIPQGL